VTSLEGAMVISLAGTKCYIWNAEWKWERETLKWKWGSDTLEWEIGRETEKHSNAKFLSETPTERSRSEETKGQTLNLATCYFWKKSYYLFPFVRRDPTLRDLTGLNNWKTSHELILVHWRIFEEYWRWGFLN
jgi:hypothetical protein